MQETLTLQFDGGSRGNPGPAGIGVVVRAEDGTPLVTLGRFIGRATNNVAEYKALITALEEAKKLGARKVIIRGDSELIVRQMTGVYKVKHPDMKVLYDQAQGLVRQFESVKFQHNLRDKNVLADKLANIAMDRKGDVTDVTDESDGPPPRKPVPQTVKIGHVGDRFTCERCGCTIEVRSASRQRPELLRPFVCQCGTPMRG